MEEGYVPTLAIVFLSVSQDSETIMRLLDDLGIVIFGATTAGEFIDGEIEGKSTVVMLLDLDPAYFRVAFQELRKESTRNDAEEIGKIGKETFQNPAFIIASGGISLDGEQIVEGIMQGYGPHNPPGSGEVKIFGGKAGDDLSLEETHVFTNGKYKKNALVALIVDEDKIDVKGIATCGWNAIGTTKTVTRSEGNTVFTIDEKPALDVLMNFLGVGIKEDGDDDVVTFLSSWYYPLQLERENVDPVIRTAMFANRKDRSLICSGNVPEGVKIKFAMPPDFDSIDKVVADCKGIQNHSEEQADALIMFSCVSRHLSFGMVIKEEIEQIQDIWDAPLVGFFTYGEYGKSKNGKYEYHNNACCLVALREK